MSKNNIHQTDSRPRTNQAQDPKQNRENSQKQSFESHQIHQDALGSDELLRHFSDLWLNQTRAENWDEYHHFLEKVSLMGHQYHDFYQRLFQTASAQDKKRSQQKSDRQANLQSQYENGGHESSEDESAEPETLDIEQWLQSTQQIYQGWVEQLEQGLESPEPDGAMFNRENRAAWREAWHKSVKEIFSLCQNTQAHFNGENTLFATENLDELFESFQLLEKLWFASTSSTHDVEAKFEKMGLLFTRYQRASMAYSLILAKNGVIACQTLKEQMAESEPGDTSSETDESENTITTLKAFYHCWLAINESVFSRSATSREYQTAYGELLNSYMTFKKAWDEIFAEYGKQYNISSQTELNPLLQSFQVLQRDNKEQQRINKVLQRDNKVLQRDNKSLQQDYQSLQDEQTKLKQMLLELERKIDERDQSHH